MKILEFGHTFVLYCNGKYWYYELCFFYFHSHYYYYPGFFPDIIFTIFFSFFRLSVLLSVMMNNIKDHLYQEFTIIHTYICTIISPRWIIGTYYIVDTTLPALVFNDLRSPINNSTSRKKLYYSCRLQK